MHTAVAKGKGDLAKAMFSILQQFLYPFNFLQDQIGLNGSFFCSGKEPAQVSIMYVRAECDAS
jgi:hypothetical protein